MALATITPPTVDALVSVMESYGIGVWEDYDGWAKGEKRERFVVFMGDDATGVKAVELARELGLKVAQLCHVWRYDDEGLSQFSPHWELYFFHAS